MAQIKLLKIAVDGVPIEMNTAADDITLNSFSVQGGGAVLSGTGLDMNNTAVSDVNSLVFTSPSTGTINQTAGNLIVDNIMGKERENLMTTAGGVSFPVITDVAGQVDAFRLPAIAGPPTATPTSGGEGHTVWDSTNDDLYIWNGTAWDNQNLVKSANAVDDTYTAAATITIRNAVYISAADNVTPAIATAAGTSQVLGFATVAAAAAGSVNVRKFGILTGFTALTPGARYYLDTAVAGAITATVPSASGSTIVQCGYAKSATSLDIAIANMGRRA